MKAAGLFAVVFIVCMAGNKLAAQCNDTIYPSPYKDPHYWPYSMRPATGCELAFFRTFHKNLVEVLTNSLGGFAAYSKQNWDVRNPDNNKGEVDQVKQFDGKGLFYNFSVDMMQGAEKNYFTLINDLGYFDWTIETADKNATPEAAQLVNEGLTAYNKPDSTNNRIQQQMNEYLARREIYAGVPNVNIQQDLLQEHHAKMEIVSFKGPAFVVKIVRDKKVVTGEADVNHNDELHIYIGKWKAPQITATPASQQLKVLQNFNLSQPRLSLQNFMIVIKCDASLFNDLLQSIDFDSLNKLIMQ